MSERVNEDTCDVALNDDGPWCTTHKQYLAACQKAGLWLAPKATEATFCHASKPHEYDELADHYFPDWRQW